ncbi:MOSC domain-containing protein [Paracoccus aerodenitrificans]|uniref:MOSC domain-containing protein n=1 Tax=Paracoccus aerodenitrificans TaxID=3017781 RepID=UPI0022F0374F|nr:MOSC domain-containing protein [Paracoccus aerodenitrificans]WBU65380.1 MOSC domain-containing protein [Paracoccus aerodenitrificans]
MKIRLLTGRKVLLAGSGRLSGIVKTPVERPLALGAEGFESDEQADRHVHGGIEKAVHHYPLDHYALWREELGDLPPLRQPGGFGENISTTGMTEKDVAVGDIFRLGTALLQVSQGRQPCWKLNFRFDVSDMARRVQMTGRTGWYYRVLQPGTVSPDDLLVLADRVAPDWPLIRLWRALYVHRLNQSELEGIAGLDVLADGWRKYAVRRLKSGRVEDWSKRLDGTE